MVEKKDPLPRNFNVVDARKALESPAGSEEMASGLMGAFTWDSAPQGGGFWSRLYTRRCLTPEAQEALKEWIQIAEAEEEVEPTKLPEMFRVSNAKAALTAKKGDEVHRNIDMAFRWKTSMEGYDYWRGVANSGKPLDKEAKRRLTRYIKLYEKLNGVKEETPTPPRWHSVEDIKFVLRGVGTGGVQAEALNDAFCWADWGPSGEFWSEECDSLAQGNPLSDEARASLIKLLKALDEDTSEFEESKAESEALLPVTDSTPPVSAETSKEKSMAPRIKDVDIERVGTKIILPAEPKPMPTKEAIEHLQRRLQQEEEVVGFSRVINCHPLDGAVALMKAMKEIYGWATPVPTMGFFGPTPPKTLSIHIGPHETLKVIWGQFVLPGVEGKVLTGYSMDEKWGLCFSLNGECKQKHVHLLDQLADKTTEIVNRESIYKGKALRMVFGADGELSVTSPPQFLDLAGTKPEELILNADVQEQVDAFILTPMRREEECRKAKIPMKRGVILEGQYGVGKTLCALITAMEAVKAGWTYILLDNAAKLKECIEFAQRYEPAVIFAEDLDRCVGIDRDDKANEILNAVDGVQSKNRQLMVVFTTNHIDHIAKAMLRPGRLDAVITVTPPDAESAIKLVRVYGRSLVEAGELKDLGGELAGQIPAVIREVVERSKLHAINRTEPGEKLVLTETALIHAARGMKRHLELLSNLPAAEKSAAERLGDGLAEVVAGCMAETLDSIQERVEEIHHATC